MINNRRGKTLSTNIPIHTLSGGVGRQAPSKRLPSESQELVNALVTVERSIEKRPGTDLMPVIGFGGTDNYTGDELGLDPNGTYEFFWHSLSDDARFLFVVDRSATASGEKLFYTFFYNQTLDRFEDHTQQNQLDSDADSANVVDPDVRAYITHGSSPLKLVSRGQNLVFLNPDAYAGYTSKLVAAVDGDTVDGDSVPGDTPAENYWVQIGLDGNPIGQSTDPAVGSNYLSDDLGLEVDYITSIKVDPAGIASIWDEFTAYPVGAQVNYLTNNKLYKCKATTTPGILPTVTANWQEITDADRQPKQISVKDYEYPISTQPQLGQSLPVFNDLNIPPLGSDVSNGNQSADVTDMLEALYDLSSAEADGKIYYIQTGYQGQPPGYYLTKSSDSPYFLKIRTPDPYSVFDSKRMPMQLEFKGGSIGQQWQWSKIDWAHRTSGDKDNNPGPTPFKNGRQSQIKTIAFFRNRLFMSAGDVVFSSRDGDFTDLWIEDPGAIIDTDPIDVAASSNQFTPITSMVPFNEYMFINTNADTQYELMGSENQITPFTAQLQPMTFYSTAPLVDPLTLGNNIFFYDSERLYLYFGRGGTLSTAQELSAHCPKYLPSSYGATAVAAAQDSILAVDADSKSDLYLYSTRYRGNEVVQNAFYQFNYDGAEIESLKSWDNSVYMVAKRGDSFFVERQLMRYDDPQVARLDRKQTVALSFSSTPLDSEDRAGNNAYFDLANMQTVIRVPFVSSEAELENYMALDSAGASYTIVESSAGTGYTDITLTGDLTSVSSLTFGKKYLMVIQMSPQFVRDDSNNVTEGILNIASLVTRHFNTGDYDILVQRRGRPVSDVIAEYEERGEAIKSFLTSFTAVRSDTFAESGLDIPSLEYQGELVSKVMGFSDKTDIYILSDYPSPVNITNLQIKGKFKQTYSSII